MASQTSWNELQMSPRFSYNYLSNEFIPYVSFHNYYVWPVVTCRSHFYVFMYNTYHKCYSPHCYNSCYMWYTWLCIAVISRPIICGNAVTCAICSCHGRLCGDMRVCILFHHGRLCGDMRVCILFHHGSLCDHMRVCILFHHGCQCDEIVCCSIMAACVVTWECVFCSIMAACVWSHESVYSVPSWLPVCGHMRVCILFHHGCLCGHTARYRTRHPHTHFMSWCHGCLCVVILLDTELTTLPCQVEFSWYKSVAFILL